MKNGSYAAIPGKIPGTPINLGGVEYILAPLNLDQVRKFESVLPTLGQKETLGENITESLPVIHASLSRNYPDITLEQVSGLIDLGNLQAACLAVISISGYEKSAGEPAPASP